MFTLGTHQHSPYTRLAVRCGIVAAFACLSMFTVAAQTRTAVDSSLKTIRAMYEKGTYLAAEVEARRYLEQQTPGDSLRITAEQYLAYSLVAQGKQKAALRHFIAILDIDSTFELDPVYTSPKILASFNEARELKRSSVREEPVVQSRKPSPATHGVSWRSLVFPGWEQLYQDRPTKGYALAGAAAVAAGLSIYFELERASARKDYLGATTPSLASTRYDRYNRAYKAESYSIIGFAVIYLYSEIDAFVNLPHSDAIAVRPAPNGLRLAVSF